MVRAPGRDLVTDEIFNKYIIFATEYPPVLQQWFTLLVLLMQRCKTKTKYLLY